MCNKISVITVVYNDVKHIRATMESYFSQTWEEKEYIVIDGGSGDGTADVIREYADRLAYWCSEPDGGIYEAMNKGLERATGDWINILNCGDLYVSATALEDVVRAMSGADTKAVGEGDADAEKSTGGCDADVVFCNSIEVNPLYKRNSFADDDISRLAFIPTFRHGSSLIKAEVHKRYPYDVSKKKSLGYALDWDMLHRLFRDGYKFKKVDVFLEEYQLEGMSNHPYRNFWYNYKITSGGKFDPKRMLFMVKQMCRVWKKQSGVMKCARQFVVEYVVNSICPHIPFWTLRRPLLRLGKIKMGKGTFIMRKCYFMEPNLLTIGEYSHINRGCLIDARGGITIGNCVSISHNVSVVTGGHNAQSPNFVGVFKPIVVNDYAWLGVGCTILQGVTIGRGAVVAAGAVVTKDVDDYEIVAGTPAKKIGTRNDNLDYKCDGWAWFT